MHELRNFDIRLMLDASHQQTTRVLAADVGRGAEERKRSPAAAFATLRMRS
jgi:hypothetical protein